MLGCALSRDAFVPKVKPDTQWVHASELVNNDPCVGGLCLKRFSVGYIRFANAELVTPWQNDIQT